MSDQLRGRTVYVPEGFRAVIVSEQLLEHARGDWTPLAPPPGSKYTGIEIHVVDYDELRSDIESRYV